jgi:hypothetical protein
LWDSGIGPSAWLVRLLVTTGHAAATISASESESQSASGDLGPRIVVRELRERLALHEPCRIIELDGPFPVHSSFPSVRSPVHVLYMIGAGTGIVLTVLAALRSTDLASAAHDTCILSTDLRESLPSQSKSSSTSIIAIIFL